MEKLRLVALDEVVVFPGMTVTLSTDAGHEKQVFLVPRKGSEYARVGVDVSERARIPGRGTASLVTGRERAIAGAATSDSEGVLRVEVQRRPDETSPRSRFADIEREYRAVVGEILEIRGDVMKESARIALTYVRSHARKLGIDPRDFENRELHVHVPAGAIPKDGPSAGVTMVTALASLLTRRPVRHTVGMTGEVTLQGRVHPIGGVKQKIIAAHAAGLRDVILPDRNRADLDDVPEEVRGAMRFHPVAWIDEALKIALDAGRVAAAA